jgi:hypothetical protein
VELQINGMDQSGQSGNTSSQQIIFKEDYTSIDSQINAIVGCSCQVNEGKTVTILSGHSLIITNELNVVGTGKALIFENNAKFKSMIMLQIRVI